jgi:hypothetical protein
MVDFGPVITPPGQYTHCVDRADYKDVPGIFKASVPEMLAFLLCDYLLGGKLVCLAGGGDECGIGRVVGVETVGSKSGFNAIDNDFSFNVLMAPFDTQDFTVYAPAANNIADPHRVRDDLVANGPLGWLMIDAPGQGPLPAPLDQSGGPGWPLGSPQKKGSATWPLDGYGLLWKLDSTGTNLSDDNREGDNLHKLWDDPSNSDWDKPPSASDGRFVPLPVLHCECEGSRIFFVCQAMTPFLDILQGKPPGGGPSPGQACHAVADSLPWPLDDVVNAVCSVVEDIIALGIAIALAPAIAAAFAAAWEAAQAFDDLFVTGPVAKQIHVGDLVIVKGRWVWDGGHSGSCELHPVKSIQKLMPPSGALPPEIRPPTDFSINPPKKVDYDPSVVGAVTPPVADVINATHERWCALVEEAPPIPDPRHPGGLSGPQIDSLTPGQFAVWTAQNRPENYWSVHPLFDGYAHNQPP